jgi:hypothetical protein
MKSIWKTSVLALALVGPVAMNTALRAQEHRYHDAERNDDHEWNNHEDRAYRMWVKENHRKYVTFEKLKDDDRANYWRWRHDHDDAKLKIVVK